ncbi:MAG: ABC transporter permease [Candidatus Aminicenantes bacterium]|nr:ABC transporter permease [Candidatus Aminicenantes bacterium]
MKKQATNPTLGTTIIEPRKGLMPIDFKEIWNYRELFYFLTKRDIKVRYKQTVLGGLWAIIQPVFTMIVFTIFFGRLAKIPSDGIPYPIFVYAGLLPWTYFANALTSSGNSLVGNANLITKVYFPRLIVPASASLAGLLDFFIAMLVLGAMMIYYQFLPGISILLFPFLLGLTFLCAVGVGLWLSALNVQYRDIRYAIPFIIQLWMFISPVIYPISIVNEKYQWLLAINPMGGLIKAYRASLLGHLPIDWPLLGISTTIILLTFFSGLYYFRRMERYFADVI